MAKTDYGRWISRHEVGEEELAAMGRQATGFDYAPLISVALVVSDTDEIWIKSSADSVLGGVYPHLELCILDNASGRPHVREALADLAAGEERVEVRRLPEKGSRAEAYNAAVSMAAGEFVALLEVGDELAPEALFRVVEFLQRIQADVMYSDEDRVDVTGDRSDPTFKPYWSPDLLLSTAYTGRMCVVRKELLDASGAFREGFEGAEEHDLMLRLSETTNRLHHLPGVLYHRRTLPERQDPGEARNEAASRAVEEALARRGENAAVAPDPARNSLRVIRRSAGRAAVSVIVAAPEGAAGLPMLGELKRETSHPVHQVIVAGGEGQRAYPGVERVSHPFPARALNLAAAEADGRFLLFVDGGARVGAPGWIPELLGHAQRRGVGAVGCRLQNPDGSLRHGGSLVEVGRLTSQQNGRVPGGKKFPPLVEGPFNFAAASAGCMMVRKAAFDAVGGFDDENLPTAFYDLDLCFRLRRGGRINVYTPYTSLVRGVANPERPPGEEEIAYMWRRWWEELVRLLYYRWSPLHPAHPGVDAGLPTLLSL